MGVIMGTAAYMSPEQARGSVADHRADVWSFGVVLYEMLTGTRLFEGATVSDVLAAVLRADPNWGVLPTDTPSAVRRLLRRCLDRDRKERLQHIGDARVELNEALTAPASEETIAAAATQTSGRRQALPWVAGMVVVGLLTGLAGWSLRPTSTPATPERFVVSASPSPSPMSPMSEPTLAISPDGRVVAYWAVVDGVAGLYVRHVDRLDGELLTALDPARGFFFSPDGAWVGFWTATDSTLKKIQVAGGPPVTLTSTAGAPRGASWGPDGTIVFAQQGAGNGLFRVSEAGGDSEMITTPEPPERHYWPEILPDGNAVLFTVESGDNTGQIAVLNLDTGESHVLLPAGTKPRYVSTGHLVYNVGETLRAVRFDMDRLEVLGDPIPVLEGMATVGNRASVAISADGTLVYQPGGADVGATRTLVWVDRNGDEEAVAAELLAYDGVELSPDGQRSANTIREAGSPDVWIYDFARNVPMQLTRDPGLDWVPVWTPGGERVLFASNRDGPQRVYARNADGTGDAEVLTDADVGRGPISMTPDGSTLLFYTLASMNFGMGLLSMDDLTTTDLFQSEFAYGHGQISPDGRLLAYESNEEGQDEIYVRPFPNVSDNRVKVSLDGGFVPRWAGNELFYQTYPDGDRATGMVTIMATRIEMEPTLSAGNVVPVFTGPYRAGELALRRPAPFDVSNDGQRFLMIKESTGAGDSGPPIILVQDWIEDVKNQFPTGQ